MLSWDGFGNYARKIVSTMQEIIIEAVLQHFVSTKPTTMRFQKFVGKDRYTLIEQPGNLSKLAGGSEVQKKDIIILGIKKNLMNIWSKIEHNRAQWSIIVA